MRPDADAGVPHLQQQLLATLARAHQHPAVVGVADGVGEQIAQHALGEDGVGERVPRVAAEAQREPLLEGHRLEVQAQPAEHVAQVEVLRRGLDAAGVDLRDVQQLGEQPFERIDRAVDAVHQVRHFLVVAALAQRLGKQAQRMQRLAQIVAGGGEELGLRAVGHLGLVARLLRGRGLVAKALRELLVLHLQHRGALQHLAEVAAEQRREAEVDEQHDSQRDVLGRALEADAQDQRQQRHRAVAEEDGELDRQQRDRADREPIDLRGHADLVEHRVADVEHQRRDAPQRARRDGAHVPPMPPAPPLRQRPGVGAAKALQQQVAQHAVELHQGHPGADQPQRLDRPEHPHGDQRREVQADERCRQLGVQRARVLGLDGQRLRRHILRRRRCFRGRGAHGQRKRHR